MLSLLPATRTHAFQPLMGNGNPHTRHRRYPLGDLPTPHGERERSFTQANRPCISNFQPLMGNGNRHPEHRPDRLPGLPTPHGERERRHRLAARAVYGLPTPHGERERRQTAARHIEAQSSNPSWGTGTPIPPRSRAMSTSFQPLMGNGNGLPEGHLHPVHYLPTPHGERELSDAMVWGTKLPTFQPLMGNGNHSRGTAQWHRSPTSNPSWGTGTASAHNAMETGIVFQPLMGNGNDGMRRIARERDELPTPHGERERRCPHSAGTRTRSSNPSWGTGTRGLPVVRPWLPTFQPLMGNGNMQITDDLL